MRRRFSRLPDSPARPSLSTESLYARPDGRLRLDLRRVGLSNGDIIHAQTVEGADLFALVDSGTARLAAVHGVARLGSIAGVTTRSVAAYSLYAQGLRSNAEGDMAGARRLFEAALREDSMFAMAAFHYGRLSRVDALHSPSRLARALRLSAHASERERLMIRAGYAWAMTTRELGTLADSLVTRYPQETQGHLYQGIARMQTGDFVGAIPPLRRVIAMDSVAFTRANSATGCDACTAMLQLVTRTSWPTRLSAAEREARRWTHLEPASARPWVALWDVLERAGRFIESAEIAARIAQIDRDAIGATNRAAWHAIRTGEFRSGRPHAPRGDSGRKHGPADRGVLGPGHLASISGSRDRGDRSRATVSRDRRSRRPPAPDGRVVRRAPAGAGNVRCRAVPRCRSAVRLDRDLAPG